MATIYYDFNAKTNGAGTPSDPKNTWAAPNNNDIIKIRRGNVFIRANSLSMGSAASLTIEAWANDDGSDNESLPKPIITGRTTLTAFMSFSGVGVHVIKNIKFREIRNATNPDSNSPACISFGAAGTINVDPGVSGEVWYCDFEGISGNAIQYNGIGSSAFASLAAERGVVKYCTFSDIGSDCIFAKIKTYFEAAYNRMERMSMRDTNGDGIGLLDTNPQLAWIHNNYIDHREVDSKQCIIVDGVDGSGLTVIENNTCIGFGDSNTKAATHVVINTESVKSIIRANKLYNCCGLGIVLNTDNSNVYANELHIINYDAASSHCISILASNIDCINNTIIVYDKTPGATFATGSGRNNINIKNNIVIGATIFGQIGNGTTINAELNNIYDVDLDYELLGTGAVNTIQANITTDPKLSPNLRLLPTSPNIGAGVHTQYLKDLEGKQFYNPPSIGAYEYERPRISRS